MLHEVQTLQHKSHIGYWHLRIKPFGHRHVWGQIWKTAVTSVSIRLDGRDVHEAYQAKTETEAPRPETEAFVNRFEARPRCSSPRRDRDRGVHIRGEYSENLRSPCRSPWFVWSLQKTKKLSTDANKTQWRAIIILSIYCAYHYHNSNVWYAAYNRPSLTLI